MERTIVEEGNWLGDYDGPTIADFNWMPRLKYLLSLDFVDSDLLERFPKLKKVYEMFYSLQQVQKYYGTGPYEVGGWRKNAEEVKEEEKAKEEKEVVDWSKETVANLKAELTKRGLDTKGKKADLVKRLNNIFGN